MPDPRALGTLLKLPATSAGLSTYLTGQFPLGDVVVVIQIPNLHAVLCGPIPPHRAELLSSELMRQFLDKAS